jgi:hypothetical protein
MVISPAGIGTKNDCAGEGQQLYNEHDNPFQEREGVTNSSQILPLVEEEAPFQNT